MTAGIAALLLVLMGNPAWAQVGSGEFTFTWSQVALLVALGAGYGDLRSKVGSIDRRLERFERQEGRR
jgi:hypothetical protein